MDPNLIILILQLITTGVICGTFWVYYKQLNVMRSQMDVVKRSAQSQALFEVIKWISGDDKRDDRKRLMRLKRRKLTTWTPREIAAAKRVCVAFDIVEILIRNEVIPSGIIELHWGRTIQECHAAANELVKHIRQNSREDAWNFFDELTKRSIES